MDTHITSSILTIIKKKLQNIITIMGYFECFFEYETPKVITVKNVPMGILRLVLQSAVLAFLLLYQLWYAGGYQEVTVGESSLTTKIKGFST